MAKTAQAAKPLYYQFSLSAYLKQALAICHTNKNDLSVQKVTAENKKMSASTKEFNRNHQSHCDSPHSSQDSDSVHDGLPSQKLSKDCTSNAHEYKNNCINQQVRSYCSFLMDKDLLQLPIEIRRRIAILICGIVR